MFNYMTNKIPLFINKSIILLVSKSILNASFMLLLTFIWLNLNITFGDEILLIQITSSIKRLILKLDYKPESKDFLFINVAYDRELIDKIDENNFIIGNQDITDRKKLSNLFHILNQKENSYKFILCDIFFEDISPNDSLLYYEMNKMNNIIISYHKENGVYSSPIFPVSKGLSDYTTSDTYGTFLKFKLVIDQSIKTTPLIMYEKINKIEYKKKNIFNMLNGKLCLNSIIVNLRIRNFDLVKKENTYNYIHLGELLSLPTSFIKELSKDRIIIIGDFEERDMHKTTMGDMAGSLILLNTYLALVNEDNIISIDFIMLLLIGYFMISLFYFYKKRKEWVIIKVM